MPTPEIFSRKRIEDFRTLKVKHPRLQEIEQFLQQAISGHRSYTLLDLYGASGVGKSTAISEVTCLARAAETNQAVFPVVIVQASPEDVGSAARLDYYQQILAQLQHYPAIRDRTKNLPLYINPRKKSNDPAEWLEIRNAVEYPFTLLQVKVVFVDEAQHLLATDGLRKPTAQLDWLKTLANKTNVLHVLVGNFDLYECCHINAQAVRRMRDYPFPRYHLDDKNECEEFTGALQSLLEQVPLAVDMPNLLKKWQWFGQWSIGCVGVLGDWIVETVDALCREGKSELTIKALENHALQPDQRARMEMEARTGEHRVARAKAQSERELAQFLGNPLQDTKATPIPTPSTDHGNSNGRIGRAPDRDPVGDQTPVIATKKCPFSGIIDIPVQQYQDSGVDRIECPDCQARRQVTPHNGILRFLTHDKRKTPGPQSEQRWVKREAGWEVILSKKK